MRCRWTWLQNAVIVSDMRKRHRTGVAEAHSGRDAFVGGSGSSRHRGGGTAVDEVRETTLRRGLADVQVVLPVFDPLRFPEEAMDIFFRVHSAWTSRDLQWVDRLLTPEVRKELQRDLGVLTKEEMINRLENITVRRAEICEASVKAGEVFVTVHFLANLLDDAVEENSGRLVVGNRETPVKSEEYWTFVRPCSDSWWWLAAIQQA